MRKKDVDPEIPVTISTLSAWAPHHLFRWVFTDGVYGVRSQFAYFNWIVIARGRSVNWNLCRSIENIKDSITLGRHLAIKK